jgi:site-specific recombinase XerD
MQTSPDFFTTRAKNCRIRLENIKQELPFYCTEYFTSIENITTPLTRLNYGYDLRIFYDFLVKRYFTDKTPKDITLKDLDSLASADIEAYLSYLSYYTFNDKEEMCNESGKARKLSSIRSFFKYLFTRDYLTSDVASKVKVPKKHEKEIIRLDVNSEVNEIADLIDTVDTGDGLTQRQKKFHNITKIRDVAMITLFLGTGIRISELVGLNVGDVNLDTCSFVVTRKGGNRSILYFGEEVKDALNDYVYVERGLDFKKDKNQPLFLSLQGSRISVRAVENIVKKYAFISAPLKKITPHKLRSSFGTNLYKETGDIYVVADCLGHKDVNTTKKHYAAITEDIRRDAISVVKLRKKD